jgi:hypothetical protein
MKKVYLFQIFPENKIKGSHLIRIILPNDIKLEFYILLDNKNLSKLFQKSLISRNVK